MSKSDGTGRASPQQVKARAAELPDVVEGQMAELCRDLNLEAKRMRKLQDQADDLWTVIREWAATSKPDSPAHRSLVEDDAEQ